MPIIIWVIILLILISLISTYYQRYLQQFFVLRIFLFVGIFIHEFSHYLACKLMFAKVYYFKVGLKQGHVTHEKSKIPILGGIIISLAPMIVGIIALILLNLWIGGLDYNDFKNSLNPDNLRDIDYLWRMAREFGVNLNIQTWQFWAYLFLIYNILATFTPSTQDYKNIIFGLVVWILVSYFTTYLNFANMALFYSLIYALILLVFATVLMAMLVAARRKIKKMWRK